MICTEDCERECSMRLQDFRIRFPRQLSLVVFTKCTEDDLCNSFSDGVPGQERPLGADFEVWVRCFDVRPKLAHVGPAVAIPVQLSPSIQFLAAAFEEHQVVAFHSISDSIQLVEIFLLLFFADVLPYT